MPDRILYSSSKSFWSSFELKKDEIRTTLASDEDENDNYALELDRKRTTMAPITFEAVPTPETDLSISETGHYKRIFTLSQCPHVRRTLNTEEGLKSLFW